MFIAPFCDGTYLKKILHYGCYWLLAICQGILHMECSSCSTTVSMADLNPPVHSNTTERVYTAFFCSDSAQHLRYILEEILFGHFVTTLNDTFEWELALEDIGYVSGSESSNIPTPLCWAPWLYHVSTQENLSFGPATPRACPSLASLNTVCCCLTYKESSLDPRIRRWWPWCRTLPHSFTGWWCLDGRTSSREVLMHSWQFTTWSVPLPSPIQFESATPHSRRCTTVHRPQGHPQVPKCHDKCQWCRYSQPGSYPQTLKRYKQLFKNFVCDNKWWIKLWYTSD